MADMRFFWAALFYLLLSLPSLLSSIEAKEAPGNNLPFSFLQDLKGCHKGDTIEGISQLKGYMKMFGYLNSNSNSNNEEFDDRLEKAIKAYQEQFHLSVTGVLDEVTVEKMMVPRCGNPDVMNRHRFGHAGLHANVHYSFFPNSPKWPPSRYNLTYAFVNDYLRDTIKPVAVTAFARWSAVSDFTFQLVTNPLFADITIGGFTGFHLDGAPFDGPGGVLAHAFAPTNGRFHLDAQESWSTNPNAQQIDLESVFIHEVGHLLGLGHSQVPQAIMFPSIAFGQIKRNLDADDIAGIQALYNI